MRMDESELKKGITSYNPGRGRLQSIRHNNVREYSSRLPAFPYVSHSLRHPSSNRDLFRRIFGTEKRKSGCAPLVTPFFPVHACVPFLSLRFFGRGLATGSFANSR